MNMTSQLKNEVSISDFEMEAHEIDSHSKARLAQKVNTARLGLTWLAFIIGIVILGVFADSLATYQSTHVGPEFNLQLWPVNLDIRPSQALIAGSVMVIIGHGLSELLAKLPLQSQNAARPLFALSGTACALLGSIIAIGYFYSAANSITMDTVQSWSCRWQDARMQTPNFGTICKESKAASVLSTILVPLEIIIFIIGLYQVYLNRSMRR